jgi:phosphonate transport system substrate-binding protein
MRSRPKLLGYLSSSIGCVALIACFLLTGCETDPNTLTVDFSKRTTILQPAACEVDPKALRVAVASITSPKQTMIYYHELLRYFGENLERDVILVQRKTYAEVNQLLGNGDIDLAFICSGPYAVEKNRHQLIPIAAPVVMHKETYRSYLIVNRDSPFTNLEALRGRTFAFSDPESNTGFLVPNFILSRIGETADHFFSKTVYTYSHDNSIMAVARNLVDGAFVHEQIWEYFRHQDPRFTSRTRVIFRSQPFGNPPVVASSHLPAQTISRIKSLLYKLHLDPQGKAILGHLMIDRYVPVKEELYDPIRQMYLTLNTQGRSYAAYQKSAH